MFPPRFSPGAFPYYFPTYPPKKGKKGVFGGFWGGFLPRKWPFLDPDFEKTLLLFAHLSRLNWLLEKVEKVLRLIRKYCVKNAFEAD